MAQSILVFGGNKEDRKNEIFKDIPNINSPDVLVIECEKNKKSIGIDQVREGIKFLQQKPFELKNKYLLIPEAYKLTTQAQNAMLKTLEEPPAYATIKLGTKTEEDLLDTVISRCKRIKITSEVGESIEKKYDIKNLNTAERFDLVEELAKLEKEEIVELIEYWIQEERKDLKDSNNIRLMLKVKEDLALNINVKLTLEYLMLGCS